MAELILAACAVYVAHGAWLGWRLPWTDGEYTLLPAGVAYHLAQAPMYPGPLGDTVQGVIRLPYRTPGAYWLYAWTPHVPATWQRAAGRAWSLGLSTAGVGLALAWAGALGGSAAVGLALLLLLGSAPVVGAYASASYEGAVATCWLAGLAALAWGRPELAAAAALLLPVLRLTCWPQAAWLCVGAGLWGVGAAVLLALWFLGPQRAVLRAAVQAARHADTSGADISWRFGLRTAAQRYEPWAVWAALALLAGLPTATPAWLLLASALTFAVGMAPLARRRPKWAVGYLPDVALPAIVALAAHVSTLGPWAWAVAGIAAGWGLARPRHPAVAWR